MSHFAYKQRATSQLHTTYVDLATLEGNARRLYSGDSCTTPFARDIEKSSWFSTIWAELKAENSSESSPIWKAHKGPDFLLKLFMRGTVPGMKLKEEYAKKGYQIATTRNLGHNMIGQVEMQFNDLRGPSFDAPYLDKYANHFTKGYDKWLLYNRMIGNIPEAVEFSQRIPTFDVKVPLPFSFTKTPPDALRLCCLKLVETKFAFHMNTDLGRLVRLRKPAGKNRDGSVNWEYVAGDVSDYLEFEGKVGKIKDLSLWGKYAVVTDEERAFHRSSEHSVVMEHSLQYDHTAIQTGSGSVTAPFHWQGAVKSIMFGVLNKTAEKYNNYSNYTTNPFDASLGRDPIKTVSLQYDSQHRYNNFPSDVFSEIESMDMPNSVPDTGHHIMNNSLDPAGNAPSGATVYDRLMGTWGVDIEDKSLVDETNDRSVRIDMPSEYSLLLRGVAETVYIISDNTIKIPIGNDK